MKKISIQETFNIFDIGDEESVANITSEISIRGNDKVQLDFSGCLIDYPYTSKIIDKVIMLLSKLDGKKNLQIKLDYNLPKATLFSLLFIGSEVLDIDVTKKDINLSLDNLESLIRKKVSGFDMSISIITTDRDGKTIEEFEYGK